MNSDDLNNNSVMPGDNNQNTDPQSVSGDELQRIASSFAQTKNGENQQAKDLEREILSSFGGDGQNLNEAVASLGEEENTFDDQEELMDLSSAPAPESLVSDLSGVKDLSDTEQVTDLGVSEDDSLTSSSSGDFPYPSVASKKVPGTPEGPSLADLSAPAPSDDLDVSAMHQGQEMASPEVSNQGAGNSGTAPMQSTPSTPQSITVPEAPSAVTPEPTPSPDIQSSQTAEAPQAQQGLDTQAQDLQQQIQQEFAQQENTPQTAGTVPEIPNFDQQTSISAEEQKEQQAPGIQKTYYSDLSDAMSSNEPRTMSELLQKSALEKKETAILSPTSKKNLMYIGGAVLLLILSVITWFVFFGGSDDIQFITEERVQSLVYSDQDLGINTTGLETFQTKAAIRKVLERDHDTDTLSQVYYVREDQFGNLRRMGVKDIFDATDNQTPTLLYNNIENEFMHGIYTTDKNYPFIVMKALSYDRAFEGMRQWEPTMIDDLATYFDLPPEATDRSLLEDGFSDDLIKNKNVRVARFIPREADRRGLLDFLRSDGNEFQPNGSEQQNLPGFQENPLGDVETNPFEQEVPTVSAQIFEFLTSPWTTKRALAQSNNGIGGTFISDTLNESQSASNTVCYRAERRCIDLLTGQELPNNTTSSATVSCYDSVFEDGTGETFTPEQVAGQNGFICREVLSGGDAVSGEEEIDTLYTNRVCFDPFSGDRLAPTEVQGELEIYPADAICYLPYQCKRVACFQGNQEVPSSREGQPGVSCQATNELVSPDADVRKSCVQFNELITLQNIDNINLCFDPFGNYIPIDSRIQSLEDYYINYAGQMQESVQQLINSGGGISCIAPQARSERLCLTDSGQLVPGTREVIGGPPVPVSADEPGIAICFNPITSSTLNEQINGGGLNQDVREIAAAIAQELTNLALLASGLGFFDNDVSDTLRDAADVFWQIAYGNILDNELILRVAETTRRLEVLLNFIDPGAPNSELTLRLRQMIAFIKSALGLQNNVAWVTLGNDLPQGVNIYANGLVTAQEGVDATDTINSLDPVEAITAVQEGLVLLGLMDPLSVNGELDLVTQQAIAALMAINGLEGLIIDGSLDIQDFINSDGTLDIQGFLNSGGTLSVDQIFISAEVLDLLQQMVNSSSGLYGGTESASIEDFFSSPMGLGAYSQEVQNLQMLLYGEGYDISGFDGIFDEEVCNAVQQYQVDNGLELADPLSCQLSLQTIESLNETIRQDNYLGSGFAVGANGALEGTGVFLGTFGPGTVSFAVGEAEANSLQEGDVVLLYTFLDEETILITRNEAVITEIIRRRALKDIFQQ